MAYLLLDSGKPGHVEPSSYSASERTDDGYQGKGCPCWTSSGQILSADLLFHSLYVPVINWVKSMRFHFFQIQHNFTCREIGWRNLTYGGCAGGVARNFFPRGSKTYNILFTTTLASGVERGTWVNFPPWGWKNFRPPKPTSHLLFTARQLC